MTAGRRQRGLTMVEMLTVMAVAGVLLALAMPDMGELIRRQQLKAVSSDLMGALRLTRAQAIARGERVMIVPHEAGGTDWSGGWVVFVDRDGNRRPGAGDEIVAMHTRVPPGVVIQGRFSSAQQPDYVAYNSGGRSCSHTSSLAARWGTLSVFQGPHTRRIKINMLGRARLCDPERGAAACTGAAESS
ncbi:GspH/FimT family pseudopilin [Massilia glaciei]|uniref:Type II secretion system protein H n=1 Tax=Massilia glaciei TaxID=1524097 RepID=A0A2U2HKI1_9BURK|nr:GspH/FimT family pseudopilin [Massilia glaciei]PWF47946.1 prepilin-type N-terminal cleavage/methylation domain-containing protein [Massilia glaciei]